MMAYSPLAYSWLSVASADARPTASRAATVSMKRLNFICMCRPQSDCGSTFCLPAREEERRRSTLLHQCELQQQVALDHREIVVGNECQHRFAFRRDVGVDAFQVVDFVTRVGIEDGRPIDDSP